MISFLPPCRARRVPSSTRRRVTRTVTRPLEGLELRALLAAGPFGINVELGSYQSYVNWLQEPVPGNWSTPGSSAPIVFNASGDPESDATVHFDFRVNQFFNGPDQNAVPPPLNGTYHLSFNGQATIQATFGSSGTTFAVQNQVYNAATNTTAADLVVPASNTSQLFGVGFVNTRATPSAAINTGISNAKLIRPGYAADSTQLYSNEFLAALKPYSVLRYVLPDESNNQPFFASNGTTLVTVDAPQVDQTGTPWEYQVTLANQTHTDMWINVPQGATDAYVAALAGIIKNGGTVNGVTYAGLDPSLKVYLEYSNEVWGGIPFNQYYQSAAVLNSADNHPLSTFPSNAHVYDNVDGTTSTDSYTALGRRYLERTSDIGRIFQGVLGADPTHQRIRPVLGWQENNFGFYPATLDWFEHFFGSAGNAFYGMGNATYWNPSDYSSVNAVITSLAAAETSYSIPNTVGFTTLATYYGLKNVSYEGGPSIGGDGSTAAGPVALAASRDPRIEQLVYQHYINYYADGGDTAAYYSGPFGTWTPQNEWEDAELAQYGNPTASPKYRGTVDVANAAPVAVTAGVHVSTLGGTTFNASTDSLGGNFSQPSTNRRAYWLLNAASAGSYDLQMSTNANGGSAPGAVEVFLNNKQIGGIFAVSASSTVDLGNLPLSAGLNTFSLYVVNGSNDPAHGTSYYEFQPTNFTITPQAAPITPPTPPPTASGPAVGDASFETVRLAPGGAAYGPAGSAWSFLGDSGITTSQSGFTWGSPAAPQGTQVAFLQNTGSITQTVSGWAAGSYQLSFQAAQRANNGGSSQDFQVLVDGTVVGTYKPTGTSYQAYTTAGFAVAAGSHTITFRGLDSVGGDNTAFLDNVAVATA